MGIVRRQSIQNSVLSYAGAFIGFFTVGLIFPNVLSTSQNGLIKIITSFALIISQFATLGIAIATYRIFPYFKNKDNKHHGYFLIPITLTFIGFIIFSTLFLIFKEPLLSNKANKTELLQQYYWLIIPYAFFLAYFAIIDGYSNVLLKSVRGTLFKDFILRILIVVVAIVYAYHYFSFDVFIKLFIFLNLFPPLAIFLILWRDNEIPFKIYFKQIDKSVFKQLADVSIFAMIAGFSGIALTTIDSIMLNKLTDLSQTGIYAIMFYFGTIVLLPARGMNRISAGLITQHWKDNTLDKIQELYSKTAITQLIIGIWIFMGIWCNMHNIFHLMPKIYQSGIYVVLLIGLSSLMTMSLGSGSQIISYSKHYRYNTYFLIILVVLAIVANYIFIPIYGIDGAAFASAFAMLCFCLIRFIFIWAKFKMQPFTLKNLWCAIIGAACILLGMYLPILHNFIIDFVYRSVIITLVYAFFVYKLHLSEDVNDFVQLVLIKLHLK